MALLALAAFLVMLAILAGQLRVGAKAATHHVILTRRIYQTTVVETIPARPDSSGAGGTSVTQSSSSSGATASTYAPPVTRSS